MEPSVWKPSGLYSVAHLSDAWFVACPSTELGKKPLARRIQDVPLVLFRQADGKPAALLDRCPHRNVPLSKGRCVQGELECPYHGWRFQQDGQCTSIPGLCTDSPARARNATSFPVVEQQGLIWVYATPGVTASESPYRLPYLEDSRYSTVRRQFTVKATLHAVVENTLDVPHTSFLHRGLFRTPKKDTDIEVVVRRHAKGAEAEFIGERTPKGLLGKLLAPQGGVLTHFDRFLLPSIAQVEYRLGAASHLVATSVLTPVSDFETRVLAVVTFRLPLPHWLIQPFVMPVASKVFRQDAWMLEKQTRNLQHFGGEQFASTEIDVLGPQVWRLLKQASRKEKGDDTFEHRLKMRV